MDSARSAGRRQVVSRKGATAAVCAAGARTSGAVAILLRGPQLLGFLDGEDLAAVLARERLGLVLPGEGDERGRGGFAAATAHVERSMGEELEPGRIVEDVRGVDRAARLLRLAERAHQARQRRVG